MRDLGVRVPNHKAWVPVPEPVRDAASAAEILAERIRLKGLPYLARYPDLDAIAHRLE